MSTSLSHLFFPCRCFVCHLKTHSERHVCNACWQEMPFALNPNFDFNLFSYHTPVKQFITQLKFHHQLNLAYWLGQWFCERFIGRLPQAILPVPLHSQRLRERGFNQALEIAKPISRYFKLPIVKSAIIRQRDTTPQTELTRSQRQTNLRGAFILKHPIPFKHIAVFDDVITTGATIKAIQRELRLSTVTTVDIWSVAKA